MHTDLRRRVLEAAFSRPAAVSPAGAFAGRKSVCQAKWPEILKVAMLQLIANDEPLGPEWLDHPLTGSWADHR
jgi:hypothetical protein